MSDQPEKLDLASASISDSQHAKLRDFFPEIFTEAGKIDFDRLKRSLGETIDAGKERFGLTWPGKADCSKTVQQPSTATLRPIRVESVNFDTTGNLIVEGDNLEVLKLLQKSYLGKVKMIYIDPPYNTGSDFIYPDNYSESLDTYLRYTGQVDSEGRKYSANTEADGRFHSKWLNMMYPRLFLARNLLREDGIIFISIDDCEIDNLRKVCNEIFGEENFVATLAWERGRKNDARRFSVGHEYIVSYARNLGLIEEIVPAWREPKEGVTKIVEEYLRLKDLHAANFSAISNGLIDFYKSLPDDDPAKAYARSRFVDERGIWRDNNISWPGGGGPRYNLLHPITKEPCKIPDDGWRFVEETMKVKIRDGYVVFREDHTKSPFLKSYLYINASSGSSEEDSAGEKLQVMGSVFYRHSQPSVDVMKGLFGEKLFENPKDHVILARLVRYCAGPTDTILDFFAGSGTTAQAVLELNKREGTNRKFILVQLPEPTKRTDFPTIADITKERVRRVIKQLDAEDSGNLALEGNVKQDRGFKVFKLQGSNFKTWNSDVSKEPAALAQQLEMHVNHIVEGRSSEDLLFEILLKSGFPLNTSVEALTLAGKSVYSIEQGAMLICLESELTPAVIQAMADRQPVRVICLDAGFAGNDQLKTNAVQQMRARGVTKFQTV